MPIYNTIASGAAEVSSMIIVNHPSDVVVLTCEGSTSKKTISSTKTIFGIGEVGSYTVYASNGELEASQTVEILTIGETKTITLGFFYGIQRDTTNSSPAWTRTGGAVGLTFTASVGSTAGHSDFDTVYPWSDIARETIDGDVFVKIPKFYFRRYKEGNVENIEICASESGGYTLHPAFQHNGATQDYIYVGAYKMTSSYKSVSGSAPLVNQTRASFRNGAKARGTGYGLIDITTWSAIEMLMMVEVADNNMQDKIGAGWSATSHTSAINTGSCDSVPNLTGRPAGTSDNVDVVWRGIEGFWGNVWEWVDGLNWNGGTYYVCNNQSSYADDTTSNYTALGFTGATSWSSSYIATMGLDTSNSAIMLPSSAGSSGTSGTTYYTDGVWSSTGWRVASRGGYWADASLDGLFALSVNYASSSARAAYGSRLLKIP